MEHIHPTSMERRVSKPRTAQVFPLQKCRTLSQTHLGNSHSLQSALPFHSRMPFPHVPEAPGLAGLWGGTRRNSGRARCRRETGLGLEAYQMAPIGWLFKIGDSRPPKMRTRAQTRLCCPIKTARTRIQNGPCHSTEQCSSRPQLPFWAASRSYREVSRVSIE